MLAISIHRQGDLIKQINVIGHAGSGEYGHDIVCAGVSSIVQGGVNALILQVDENNYSYQLSLGDFQLQVTTKETKTQTIVSTIAIQLISIAKDYKQYIKLREENYEKVTDY
jgi:uncharacterized protein YsxB (DUF464 family)